MTLSKMGGWVGVRRVAPSAARCFWVNTSVQGQHRPPNAFTFSILHQGSGIYWKSAARTGSGGFVDSRVTRDASWVLNGRSRAVLHPSPLIAMSAIRAPPLLPLSVYLTFYLTVLIDASVFRLRRPDARSLPTARGANLTLSSSHKLRLTSLTRKYQDARILVQVVEVAPHRPRLFVEKVLPMHHQCQIMSLNVLH